MESSVLLLAAMAVLLKKRCVNRLPIDPGSSVSRINAHWKKDTDTRAACRGVVIALDAEIMLDPIEKEFHFRMQPLQLASSHYQQRYVVVQTKQRIYPPILYSDWTPKPAPALTTFHSQSRIGMTGMPPTRLS
jgi:hypothetical protein